MTSPRPVPLKTLTPANGGVRLGTLDIVDRLGVGGVAEVFRAIRHRPGKPTDIVVLKKMRPEAVQNTFFSERFMAEADLLQMLRHPNVVGGHEVGSLEGQPYVLIDYVDGKDLGAVQKGLRSRQRMLETASSIYVVMELLRGLGYVHRLKSPSGRELRVVHRDVTPDNVLVSYDGDVFLTDFGIALLEGIETQDSGDPVAGKLGYLAPEQAARQPMDQRSDLFAVGCVLYELTVGSPAFVQAAGETEAAVLERVAEARFHRPTKVDPTFPRDLEKVIMTAMERKPRNRFPSAAEFLDALDDLAFIRPGERDTLGRLMRDFFWQDYGATRLTLPP